MSVDQETWTRPPGEPQGAVFDGVGAQLVQGHRQAEGHGRRHAQVRPVDLKPAAVVGKVAVGREGLGDDLAEARAFPVLPGEDVVAAGEGEEAGLEGSRGGGQILDPSLAVSVPRKLWAARDWTVASVFFTRWFSSLMQEPQMLLGRACAR